VMVLTVLIVLASVGIGCAIALLAAGIANAIYFLIPLLLAEIPVIIAELESIYFGYSVRLMGNLVFATLYETIMLWASITPPPLPFPTDPIQMGVFLWMYFRVVLLNRLFDMVSRLRHYNNVLCQYIGLYRISVSREWHI